MKPFPFVEITPANLVDIVRRLSAGLRNGLTFAENFAGETIEQEFDGPATSLSFATKYRVAPQHVFLSSLTTDSGATGVPCAWGWSFADGAIVTTAFAGLASGTYRARLLIVRE